MGESLVMSGKWLDLGEIESPWYGGSRVRGGVDEIQVPLRDYRNILYKSLWKARPQ